MEEIITFIGRKEGEMIRNGERESREGGRGRKGEGKGGRIFVVVYEVYINTFSYSGGSSCYRHQTSC